MGPRAKDGTTNACSCGDWGFTGVAEQTDGKVVVSGAYHGELGNPGMATGYALCVYDGSSSLVAELDAPAGGSCGTRPWWTRLGASAVRRTDETAASDGLVTLQVQAGASGKSQALLKAKGPSLAVPAPLALPVRVQLQVSTGLCAGSTYSTAMANEAGRFQAKSD